MSEVLYWAGRMKTRWMEEKTSERGDTYTQYQTQGGGDECLRASEQRMEMEEKETGERPNS